MKIWGAPPCNNSRMQTADQEKLQFKASQTLQRATNAHSKTEELLSHQKAKFKQQSNFWVRERAREREKRREEKRESQWKQHSCKYSNWNYRSEIERNATTYPEKVFQIYREPWKHHSKTKEWAIRKLTIQITTKNLEWERESEYEFSF